MTAKTLTDYFNEHKDMPPFAAGDTDLILDVDFRNGETATDALLVTALGFTKAGSGGLWDATRGFNPNGTRGYNKTNFLPAGMSARTEIGDNVTIHVEVEREALASCWADDATFFIDNTTGPSSDCWNGTTFTAANHRYGDYTSAARFGSVFKVGDNASPFPFVDVYYQVTNSGGNPIGRGFLVQKSSTTNDGGVTLRCHGDKISSDDDFMTITITIDRHKEMRWYVDGVLIKRYVRVNTVTADDLFDAVSVGVGSGNYFRGYIRRFQIAKRAAKNTTTVGTKVALFGDSFAQRSSGHATPGSTTVAAINAVQNALNDVGVLSASSATDNPIIGAYWFPTMRCVQRLAAQDGLRFRWYTAAQSGKGWSSTVGGGTVQFAAAYRNALIAYNPEIVIAYGSLNDVNVGLPAANLLAETKLLLDEFIDGCSALRKILFFTTFPGYKGENASAAKIAQYESHVTLQNQLQGYRGIVQVIDTYAWLGGAAHNANYTVGGHEATPLWDARFTKTLTLADIHPGQYGMNRMAEMIWQYLEPELFALPRL